MICITALLLTLKMNANAALTYSLDWGTLMDDSVNTYTLRETGSSSPQTFDLSSLTGVSGLTVTVTYSGTAIGNQTASTLIANSISNGSSNSFNFVFSQAVNLEMDHNGGQGATLSENNVLTTNGSGWVTSDVTQGVDGLFIDFVAAGEGTNTLNFTGTSSGSGPGSSTATTGHDSYKATTLGVTDFTYVVNKGTGNGGSESFELSFSTIPEPSVAMLTGLSAFALLVRRKRK